MTRMRSLMLLPGISLAVFAAQSAAQQPDQQRDKEARNICQKFWENVANRQLPALVEASTVPFYAHGLGQSRVVSKKEELRELLSKLLPAENTLKDIRVEIGQVLTFQQILETHRDEIGEEERKLLEQALKGADRVLNVQFKTSSGQEFDRLLTIVGRRDGQAKVVGIRD